MEIEVKVPVVGESVQEGMIAAWLKKDGDTVATDEALCELETDKATVEVTASAPGVLKRLIEAGTVVKVGQVIAKIQPSAGVTAQAPLAAKAPTAAVPSSAPTTSAPERRDGPAVARIAAEQNLDLKQFAGSGPGGRVTKEDIVNQSAAPSASQTPAPAAVSKTELKTPQGPRAIERKPMSMLRRRIAERLVTSQHTAAILTTFNEVDLTAINEARNTYKDSFEKRHKVKLGFMGFFLKASVLALQEFPLVNASIDGDDIVYHHYCDIGVAVSTEKGLMVPVIRNVDTLSIAGIEQAIKTFGDKARDNKISLDDLSGGTFTVSNGGIFGSLLSTPIINPPQTAILGMHKIQQRAMVMPDGSIKARPMMYLALSYDHRLLDGKEAVQFLVHIKNNLEDPQRMLLGV
jgi:2-oxoglutarate dehydrogenase E2 component (dihydrolipoamide succinyltransferase)